MVLSTTVPVYADEFVGRMSAAFGYALNDMIFEYGVIKTQQPNDAFFDPAGGEISPGGIVYADILNFDANQNPYLVVFTTNSDTRCAEAHVWKYNEETKKAEKIATLNKSYANISRDRMGEFNVGYNDEKRYISYKEYENNQLISTEYYTVMEGETFMYVNSPKNVYDIGIMNFNCAYFHPGVDVTDYNKALDQFFTNLKNSAADSVTFEDIAEKLKPENETELEKALSKAVQYSDFDILRFNSMEEYNAALDTPNCSDRFYLITNMYNLDDEIYYVRFSTDRSFYNYTLLRRSDNVEGGYQILKVKADCIPLSDSELRQAKEECSRCKLLFKKASGRLHLKSGISFEGAKLNLPKIDVEKRLDPKVKLPIALIGGGIALSLLIVLWFVIAMDDE